MRIVLKLSASQEIVPYNYQHQLTGVVHKWLGENDLHGQISLMSFGWLKGATPTKKGLLFPNGATWFINFFDADAAKKLVFGLFNKPEVCYGLRVAEASLVPNPEFGNKAYFKVSSPVLIRKNINEKDREHLIWNHPDAPELLTRTLQTRIIAANLEHEAELKSVWFDTSFPNAQTKLIQYKTSNLRTSICPIWVEGNAKALQFAWNVGIGELTGSGFGALE